MGELGALVKLGQQEHISQLREEGLLYMNNLPYFWAIEDEELRGDPLDGVEVWRGHDGTVVFPDGTEAPLKITNWHMRRPPSEPEKLNVFCMYALRPSAGTFPVDKRNLRFGGYALVVTNVPEFMDRIQLRLDSMGINFQGELVEYVDDEHTGDVGPFRKRRRFAYQSEWRLVCYDGPAQARIIRIGSVEDISTMMPCSEVNQRCQEMLLRTYEHGL